MSIERTRRKKAHIEILPMIDVVFFLLIFFLIFTTIKTTPDGIDVTLPQAASGASQEPSIIEVTVARAGDIYVNGEQTTLVVLQSMAADMVASRPDLIVIIRADQATAWNNVVQVMDSVRQGGAYRISYAVEGHSDQS